MLYRAENISVLWRDAISRLKCPKKLRPAGDLVVFKYSTLKVKENRIFMVTSAYVLEVLCFVQKYKGNFKQTFVIHEHNTKRKYDLHTQFCNTTLFQKSVLNMGVKLYKHLRSEIKKLDNFNRFRKEVKSALLNNSFYMIEEFLQSKSV